MPQFLLGFWCGCLFAVLACFVMYYYVKRMRRAAKKEQFRKQEECEGRKETLFSEPKARILLVDDSKLSRKVIKEFLKNTEIELVDAENGVECLAKVKKESFDLIFMDMNMPGLSGLETLERLQKETEGKKEIPVVVMGSTIRKENEAEYLEKGFAGCLAKPIQGNRLEELLLRLLPEDLPVQKPEGFSYLNGLKNFDGNDDVYRETLVLFASLWEERREMLRQFLEEENMKEYAILIHAIKGDARTLGAEHLAKLAYEQELSAKEGNAEAVRNSFERVMKVGTDTADYFVKSFSTKK